MSFSNCINLLPSTMRLTPLLVILALLSACGGGSGGEGTFLPQADDGSGGGGGVIVGGDDPTTTIVVIGGQIDGTFVEGQVALGLSEISATGLTSVSVELRDADSVPLLTAYEITFSSPCVAAGDSSITPATVTTSNGVAQADYAAEGCEGNDEITATAIVGEETLTATATLLVEPDDIGSVEFVSATPNQIALAGSGGTENSVVTFIVRGETGSPIQDATVNFELNSTTGGLSLFPDNDVSGADGIVSTTVSAGTIATSIRITATEESSSISTQSSELVVSTGIPDDDSFSISLAEFNPEGRDYDGETVEVTVRAADAFNNPAPEGTSISFYAEGGSIDPTCSTDINGACSVTWRSQQPKPDDGRVTILASAIGNESFTDSNGNGLFDDIDVEFNSVNDLGEAYADINENGAYDIGEFFIDFGTPNGLRDDPDGAYNGVLCADSAATRCAAENSVLLSAEAVLIMAGSAPTTQNLRDASNIVIPLNSSIAISENSVTTFRLWTADNTADNAGKPIQEQNNMPSGTSVAITSSSPFTLGSVTQLTVSGSATPDLLEFTLIKSDMELVTGTLTVTYTTPNGVITRQNWNLQGPPP